MSQAVKAPDTATSGWSARLRASFHHSAGHIVFGMEDGTVSIFGLVFGVAASAPDAHAVLLAGATGAIAAAVSMMAGTYLDVESENDAQTAAIAERQRSLQLDPDMVLRDERERLTRAGFANDEIESILSILSRHPDTASALDSAFQLGIAPASAEQPAVQAAWMFFSDLFAAFVPVLPFAIFALGTARIVSLIFTTVLLILLGVGRARVGHQSVVATTLETIAIAAGAALAGVLVSRLIA